MVIDHCDGTCYYYHITDCECNSLNDDDLLYEDAKKLKRLYCKVDNFEKIFGGLNTNNIFAKNITNFTISPQKYKDFSEEKCGYVFTDNSNEAIDFTISSAVGESEETINKRVKPRVETR